MRFRFGLILRGLVEFDYDTIREQCKAWKTFIASLPIYSGEAKATRLTPYPKETGYPTKGSKHKFELWDDYESIASKTPRQNQKQDEKPESVMVA